MNIGELKASIELQTRAFSEGIKKIKQALNDLGALSERTAKRMTGSNTKISKSFSTTGKSAKSFKLSIIALNQGFELLRNGAAALQQTVGALSGSFIYAASRSEQFRIRIDTALGSVSEGSRLFKEMSVYAAQVPFQFEHIMESATALAPIVEGGVEGVKTQMKLIGDLAALTGLTLREATGNFIKMYSAGAAAADLFRERGILPLLGFLPKVSYGVEETRKKLAASAQMIEGITKRLAVTWEGQISMMQDKWFLFRKAVMDEGPFSALKAIIYQLNDSLMEVIENDSWTEAWGETITNMIVSTLHIVGDLVNGVGTIWTTLEPVLSPVFKMISDGFSSLWNFYQSLPDWAKPLGLIGAVILGPLGVGAAALITQMAKVTVGIIDATIKKVNGEMSWKEYGELMWDMDKGMAYADNATDKLLESINNTDAMKKMGFGQKSKDEEEGGPGDFFKNLAEGIPEAAKIMEAQSRLLNVRKSFNDMFNPQQMKLLGKIDTELEKITIGKKGGGQSAYEEKLAGINYEYNKLNKAIDSADKPGQIDKFINETRTKIAVWRKELEAEKNKDVKAVLQKNIEYAQSQIQAAMNASQFIDEARDKNDELRAAREEALNEDRQKAYDDLIQTMEKEAHISDDSFQSKIQNADKIIAKYEEEWGALNEIQKAEIRAAEAAKIRAQVNTRAKQQLKSAQSQLAQAGKNANQRGQMTVDKQIAELKKQAGGSTPAIEQLNDALNELNRLNNPDTWQDGIQSAMNAVGENAQTAGTEVKKLALDTYDSMSTGFKDIFCAGVKGELADLSKAFESFFNGILNSMMEILSNRMASSFMDSIFDSIGSSGGSGGGGFWGSLFGSLFAQAKGGAWNKGAQFFASGGVVNQPTLFKHSSGLGVMGEAGAEAILPLVRMGDGDLGVRAQVGASSPPPVRVVVNNNGNDADARAEGPEWNGQEWVVQVWLDAYHRNAYGLKDGMKAY